MRSPDIIFIVFHFEVIISRNSNKNCMRDLCAKDRCGQKGKGGGTKPFRMVSLRVRLLVGQLIALAASGSGSKFALASRRYQVFWGLRSRL